MGLDMFLYCKNSEESFSEIGYWRKANHIHNWFIRNQVEDNCEPIDVNLDELKELKSLCSLVLNSRSLEHSLDVAMAHLPPLAGFFFGSIDIDDWYYNQTMNTIDIINKCEESGKTNFIYRASW